MQYILLDRRELDRAELTWEEMHACLVVANDEAQARQMASGEAYGEGAEVWLDSKRVAAWVLADAPDQEARILLDKTVS